MFRFFVLAVLLAVPLSCAHSGHIVRYSIYCPQTCGWSAVSYRGAYGMEQGKALNDWSHQVVSEPGEQFVFTVQRTDGLLREPVYIYVYIDDREVMSERLEPGDAGPITLAGEVP